MRARGAGSLVALVAFAGWVAGCVDPVGAGGSASSDDVGGAGFHVRGTDFYHSFRSNAESWSDSFRWSNPEGRAHLEVRHSISVGSEKVVVRDAQGATVFTQEFSRGTREGEFGVGSGAPGEWTVELARRGASGQFDLHVWRDVLAG